MKSINENNLIFNNIYKIIFIIITHYLTLFKFIFNNKILNYLIINIKYVYHEIRYLKIKQ